MSRVRVFGFLLAAALIGCGDDASEAPVTDSAVLVEDTAAPDVTTVSDSAETAPSGRTGCLDRPELPTAPTGSLPCELIPPGLTLP